jgi:hypothetical protein
LEKNEISKLHEEWKISPSQVYGQGSKNGSVIHPFSKMPGPSPNFLIIPKKNLSKKILK